MNEAGLQPRLFRKWNLLISDIYVVIDDVDLPLGLRIRPKGGDGCHKGLENIIYHLGQVPFQE